MLHAPKGVRTWCYMCKKVFGAGVTCGRTRRDTRLSETRRYSVFLQAGWPRVGACRKRTAAKVLYRMGPENATVFSDFPIIRFPNSPMSRSRLACEPFPTYPQAVMPFFPGFVFRIGRALFSLYRQLPLCGDSSALTMRGKLRLGCSNQAALWS